MGSAVQHMPTYPAEALALQPHTLTPSTPLTPKPGWAVQAAARLGCRRPAL